MRSRLAGPYIEKEAKIKDRKSKQIVFKISPVLSTGKARSKKP